MNHNVSTAPELFAVAIGLPPSERERYLDSVCPPGSTQRAEMDRLIASHERAHDFLESPPISLSSIGPIPLIGDEDPAPTQIGNYRILKVLGSGGMGRVYLAESEKPRRRVALKVIKPGTASSAMLRRFEQEAQVVALLQHPGIAQIFEAGTAPGALGTQPYIAMEYVDGPLLSEYIKQRSLDVRDKLLLFCKICDAVMHAHHKGVIHRDLKPANILVDSSGQPKILDFGVARLTDPETRSQTLHTHAGQLIGTLAYMSPEQVAGEPGGVDSRSDVYALGVILYEILTGKLPHDVNQRPIPEAIRIIREDTPTSLSTLDRGYRGDIETIVGKALEKDAERRYQSAKELADDIRRSLRDEPIVARRPSTWYQFRKFAKRNKTLVGGAAATFAALAVGLVTALSQAQAADVARVDAVKKGEDLKTALSRAEESLEVTKGLNGFLSSMIEAPDPNNHLGTGVTVLQALELSEQNFEDNLPTQPHVRAAIHLTIGQTYRSLAKYAKSETHLRQAYELYKSVYGPDHEETVRALTFLCLLLSESGKTEQGLELAEPAYRKAKLDLPETSEIRVMIAGALASLLDDQERLREALPLAEYVAEQRVKRLGSTHETALNARYTLARYKARLGNYTESISIEREVVAAHRESGRPASTRSITWYVGLGIDLQDTGQFNELAEIIDEVLPMAETIYDPDHPGLLSVLSLKGAYLQSQNRLDEAEEVLKDVAAKHRRTETPVREGLARVLSSLGGVLRAKGDIAGAEGVFREALDLLGGPNAKPNRLQLVMMTNLLTTVRLQKKFDEALPIYKQLVETAEQVLDPSDWTMAAHRYGYGVVLMGLRKPEEAERQLLLAEAQVSKVFPETDEKVITVRRSLVDLYRNWQKPEEKAKWLEKLPEQYRKDE